MTNFYVTTLCVVFLISEFFATQGSAQDRPSPEYQRRKAKQLAGESPFQREIDGKERSRILYQDSLVTVLDGLPSAMQAPIHLLAVPNRRIPTLNELKQEESALIGHLIWALKNEARKKGIAETGYRIAINTNEDAGQSAFHIHAHLLGGVRTGPMVDQGWRMIQRAKRGTDSLTHTPAMQDTLLTKLMGTWTGKGVSFGFPAKISMTWQPEMQFQYMKLIYRLEMRPTDSTTKTFDGEAIYKPLQQASKNQEKTYQGSWHDSQGEQYNITATAHGNSLESIWGDTSDKMVKTTYTLLDANHVEIADFIRKADGTWKELSRNTVQRVDI